jgi:hypothetical protein
MLVDCPSSAVVLAAGGQECPPHMSLPYITPHQAENEVPQPHDFVACGFTKTKPCCISVS